MEANTIERIAEILNVNFYDLAPLIQARDEAYFKAGMQKVEEVINAIKQTGYMSPDEINKWLEEQGAEHFVEVSGKPWPCLRPVRLEVKK